jgi:uncharacterized protein
VFWLLLATGVAGLLLTVLGFPGLWLFLAVALVARLVGGGAAPGWAALGIAGGLALLGELVELTTSTRYTRRYGGSRRAGWGALIGGLVGAIVGVPVPVIGSVIGSFAGAFLGALIGEFTVGRDHRAAGRAAWGAVLGRAVATAAKIGLGCLMVVVILWSSWG